MYVVRAYGYLTGDPRPCLTCGCVAICHGHNWGYFDEIETAESCVVAIATRSSFISGVIESVPSDEDTED